MKSISLRAGNAVIAATMLFSFASTAPSQETKIISPPIGVTDEGDSNSDPDCCGPFRYQEIIDSDDFGSLPQEAGRLTRIAWRPDGVLVTEPRTVNNGNVLILMSYTSKDPTDISAVFEENVESEQVKVFDGVLTQHTDNLGRVGGPKEADYIVDLDTPFLYELERGNLLIDYTFADGLSPSNLADRFTDPPRSVFGDAGAASGTVLGSLVHEFTFMPVPEPSSAFCLTGLLIGVLWLRMPRA